MATVACNTHWYQRSQRSRGMEGYQRSLQASTPLRSEMLKPVLSQTHDASLQAHFNTNGISESMAHVGLRVRTARAAPRAADAPRAESHSSKSPGPQPPADLKKIYVNPEVRRSACKSSGRPCMWASENLELPVPCACHEPCISAM